MPRMTVDGAELYFEVRGMGPLVLLIMGATGDGGHFDEFADLLADEFTVVSYDRRGNGRSPVPAGWQTTSPEEQADDAAALARSTGEITHRLGELLGVEVATTPGTHGAYHDHPHELAEAVRPFLREVTA